MGIPGPGVLELGLGLMERAGGLSGVIAAAVARTRQVSIIAVASGVVRFPAMSQGLLPGQQLLIGRRDIARTIQVDHGLQAAADTRQGYRNSTVLPSHQPALSCRRRRAHRPAWAAPKADYGREPSR